MFKSYWRAFAYLGLALVIGVTFGFFLGRIEVRDAAISAEHRAERAQDVSKNSYGIFPSWPSAGAPVGSPSAYTSEDKTDQRDLVAQEWMAWAAFWMLIVTSVGVYFVAQTLGATQKALTQAGAATKAAEDAVKVTAKFAYFQTRPFLSHHGINYKVHDARIYGNNEAIIQIDLNIRNRGKTPANTDFGNISFAITPKIKGVEIEPEDCVIGQFFTVRKQVAPDFDGTFPCRIAVDWDILQDALVDEGVIWIWGFIPYHAIFDSEQKHVMNFKYFLVVGGQEAGMSFDATAGGNEAT